MENGVVELAGRRFQRASSTTVQHDFWLMNKIREAGLDNVGKAGDTAEERVEAILDRCLSSGSALVLLGGLILPEGMDPRAWTPEVADDITNHIKGLTEFRDKMQVKPLVASMLIGFFQSGLVSLKISLKSSIEDQEPELEIQNANTGAS